MSKKKNVRRKKSNNLLKGVAAAGAVVGGGTIFAGNNAVYAAETDQGPMGLQSQTEEQYIESQSASQSQTTSYTDSESDVTSYSAAPAALSAADQVSVAQDAPSTDGDVETEKADQNSVGTNVESKEEGVGKQFADALKDLATLGQGNVTLTAEGQEGTNDNSASNKESVSLYVSGSMSESLSEVGSQISSESISGNEAESKMASESSSISASTEEFKSDSASLSTSTSLSSSTETSTYTSESESLSKEFTSASESFESKKIQTLEDLITNINNAKRELEEIRQNAIKDNHHYLNGAYQNDAYRKKADELAKYLAQYNFFQKYGVGKVTEISTQYNNNGVYSDNNGNSTTSVNYYRNNFFVKYQTEDNKIYTGYFDWVAVQEKIGSDGKPETDKNGNILYEYTPYEKTDPSKMVQIMVIEKAPIYSDESWGNHGSKFYYYEDTDGKIHAYFSEKDNRYFGAYYSPNFKEIGSFSKDDIISENGSTIKFKYKGNEYTFTVKKTIDDNNQEFPYFGQVQDDLNIDANSSTTIKGKSYFSIKDFEKQQTKYDQQRSQFTSVSEKQSRHKSDSIKNSQSKSESLSLSISNSNSKSNVDTSDSLSKSKSLSLVNSDIASRSISHSLMESAAKSTSIANSQSTSTSVANSQSTSTSVANSQSTSTSVANSQSTSTSVANSQSTSTSVANSQSTSTSVANSQSTSTSVANSQSTSTSVANSQSALTSASQSASTSVSESESLSNSVSESLSLSESVSGSLSESESASTVASESLSNSLSSSESNSLSSSESASASDSFATSVTTTTTGGDTSYRRVVVDTRAPLQVAPRETEEVVEDETPKANPEKTETIEKEKMPKSTLDVTHRVWWSWIPIVGALISMNETRKRRKEEKEEESKDKKLK